MVQHIRSHDASTAFNLLQTQHHYSSHYTGSDLNTQGLRVRTGYPQQQASDQLNYKPSFELKKHQASAKQASAKQASAKQASSIIHRGSNHPKDLPPRQVDARAMMPFAVAVDRNVSSTTVPSNKFKSR